MMLFSNPKTILTGKKSFYNKLYLPIRKSSKNTDSPINGDFGNPFSSEDENDLFNERIDEDSSRQNSDPPSPSAEQESRADFKMEDQSLINREQADIGKPDLSENLGDCPIQSTAIGSYLQVPLTKDLRLDTEALAALSPETQNFFENIGSDLLVFAKPQLSPALKELLYSKPTTNDGFAEPSDELISKALEKASCLGHSRLFLSKTQFWQKIQPEDFTNIAETRKCFQNTYWKDCDPKDSAPQELDIYNHYFKKYKNKYIACRLLGKEVCPWKSEEPVRFYGGRGDPYFLPLKPGYNNLLTYYTYNMLLGLLISDGYINKNNQLVLEFSNRKASTYGLFRHVLKTCAHLIDNVDLWTRSTKNPYVPNIPIQYSDSSGIVNQQTGNTFEYDLSDFLLKNKNYNKNFVVGKSSPFQFRLNSTKIKESLIYYLNKVANQPIICEKAQKNKENLMEQNFLDKYKNPHASRITFKPIFEFWRLAFYDQKDGTNVCYKVLPQQAEKLFISPIALAFWIAGDGSSNSATTLRQNNTQSLNNSQTVLHIGTLDAKRVQHLLYTNFRLATTIQKGDLNKKQLDELAKAVNEGQTETALRYLDQQITFTSDTTPGGQGAANLNLLYQMVSPYLLECMYFKVRNPVSALRLKPVNRIDPKAMTGFWKTQPFFGNQSYLPSNQNPFISSFGILVDGKVITPETLFLWEGDISQFSLYENSHNVICLNGDRAWSPEVEAAFNEYLSLVFAVKKHARLFSAFSRIPPSFIKKITNN